jgi:phosphate acetyltransferase
MPHTLFLAPSGSAVGLTTVALGLLRALDSRGVRVAFFKPIGQIFGSSIGAERSTHFVRSTTALEPTQPIPLDEAERLILGQRMDELMSRVVGDFHRSARDADIVIVEGLVHTPDTPLEVELNEQLIKTLSADVILVGAVGDGPSREFVERIELAAAQYTGGHHERVLGVIANRVAGLNPATRELLALELARAGRAGPRGLRLLGAIPDNPELGA